MTLKYYLIFLILKLLKVSQKLSKLKNYQCSTPKDHTENNADSILGAFVSNSRQKSHPYSLWGVYFCLWIVVAAK